MSGMEEMNATANNAKQEEIMLKRTIEFNWAA
jgi:hypothetical protein